VRTANIIVHCVDYAHKLCLTVKERKVAVAAECTVESISGSAAVCVLKMHAFAGGLRQYFVGHLKTSSVRRRL